MKYNQELREEKFAMIRRWEESGLSQKKFTEQENIVFNNFYYWLKKYRKQKQKQDAKEKRSGFVKISVPKQALGNAACLSEVVFVNGNRIKFYNAIEISQLKQLAL